MSCLEGKGGVKDIQWIEQNAALFVDLLWNMFWIFYLGIFFYYSCSSESTGISFEQINVIKNPTSENIWILI